MPKTPFKHPLVLLHGFPLDQTVWDPQRRELASLGRLITPDLRGFGKAGPPAPFSMESQADALHALLESQHALPCVLGGLSMGGYVTLAFWKKYPADLRGLIFIDTRAAADNPDGKKARQAMIELATTRGSPAVADQMLPKLLAPGNLERLGLGLRAVIENCPAQTIAHACAAMRDREDFVPRIPGIRLPTLIVVGELDQLTPPHTSRQMHDLIPGSRFVEIPGAGHMAPIEAPAQVTAAMLDFLQTID